MSASRVRPDNSAGGPERSFRVTQYELERAVRESLSRQVAVPRPIVADPAGLAIRAAKRVQRRRALTGVALAAVATVLISTGVAQLGEQSNRNIPPTMVLGNPPGPASPPQIGPTSPQVGRGPGGTAVDLIVGTALTTTGGDRVQLSDVGPVERALRVSGGGWLVLGAPTAAGHTLWSVRPDGASRVMLAGADAIAVAADGQQVAWRDGPELFAAGVVGGQVIAAVRTAVPDRATPVGFVGDAVLVRLDPGRPGYALWRPGSGPPRPGADTITLNVYGVLPDGRAIGQVSAGTPRRPCLAVLDPARDLDPIQTGCGLNLSTDGHGVVSSDGRWLVLNGRAGDWADGPVTALLVDLRRAFGPTPVARPAGPPLAGVVAWAPPQTAVYVEAKGGLVQLGVDRVVAGDAVTAAPVPGGAEGDRPVVVTGGMS